MSVNTLGELHSLATLRVPKNGGKRMQPRGKGRVFKRVSLVTFQGGVLLKGLCLDLGGVQLNDPIVSPVVQRSIPFTLTSPPKNPNELHSQPKYLYRITAPQIYGISSKNRSTFERYSKPERMP